MLDRIFVVRVFSGTTLVQCVGLKTLRAPRSPQDALQVFPSSMLDRRVRGGVDGASGRRSGCVGLPSTETWTGLRVQTTTTGRPDVGFFGSSQSRGFRDIL